MRGTGIDVEASTLAELRGFEGRRVRDTYSRLAHQHGIQQFRRQATGAKDPVNIGLNIGNAILYGLAGTVCAALSLNPALGVIHEGNSRAFLFDLGDLYKEETSMAGAFECGNMNDLAVTRKRIRELIHQNNVLEDMMRYTCEFLTLGGIDAETGDRLFDPTGDVEAHTNWGLT